MKECGALYTNYELRRATYFIFDFMCNFDRKVHSLIPHIHDEWLDEPNKSSVWNSKPWYKRVFSKMDIEKEWSHFKEMKIKSKLGDHDFELSKFIIREFDNIIGIDNIAHGTSNAMLSKDQIKIMNKIKGLY